MEFIKLNAKKRESRGKGSSRRLRVSGYTPAVIYGKNTENTPICVSPDELIKALSGPLRVNTPLDIVLEDLTSGKPQDVLAIVKDHQYDPVTRKLLHVDFLSIKQGEKINVIVPVIKKGRSIGEQLGGVLRMVHRTAPVVCMPKDIPEAIVINVAELKNGITLHAFEVTMPEGVVLDLPPNEAILTISALPEEDAEETTAEEKPKAKK